MLKEFKAAQKKIIQLMRYAETVWCEITKLTRYNKETAKSWTSDDDERTKGATQAHQWVLAWMLLFDVLEVESRYIDNVSIDADANAVTSAVADAVQYISKVIARIAETMDLSQSKLSSYPLATLANMAPQMQELAQKLMVGNMNVYFAE